VITFGGFAWLITTSSLGSHPSSNWSAPTIDKGAWSLVFYSFCRVFAKGWCLPSLKITFQFTINFLFFRTIDL
jgi:hypothetical protein